MAAAPLPSPAPDALKVVTTTSVFADIVRNVARGACATWCPSSPLASGPRTTSPRPGDALLLGGRGPHRVQRGRPRRLPPEAAAESGTGGQTPQVGARATASHALTVDGEQNPHFWLDPTPRGAVLRARHHRRPELHRPGTRGGLRPRPATPMSAQIEALDTQLQAVVDSVPEAESQARDIPRRVPVSGSATTASSWSVSCSRMWARSRRLQSWRALSTRSGRRASRPSSVRRSSTPRSPTSLADEAGVSNVVTNLYNDALGAAACRHVPWPDALRYRADRRRPPMTDRPSPRSPSSMSRPDTADRLALDRCPAGRRCRVAAGGRRPERRRQEHAAQDHGRTAAPRVGHASRSLASRSGRPRGGSPTCPRRKRSTGSSRWPCRTW